MSTSIVIHITFIRTFSFLRLRVHKPANPAANRAA
jgi:hypothetical protein